MVSYQDVHLLVETIVCDEIVCHAHAVRLHGMSETIAKVSNVICESESERESERESENASA